MKEYLRKAKQYIALIILLILPFIYYFIFEYIITFSDVPCSDKTSNISMNHFGNISDYISSYILLLGFSLAIIILLSNKKAIPSNYIIRIIEDIPDFIPFSDKLKHYLLSLIKKNYKIVVMVRSINEKNSEWVLNQIAAYNNISKDCTINENIKIEYIFVDDSDTTIKEYMNKLQTSKYNYILITSLSKIFKQTIQIRQSFKQQEKDCIQIIGALSSISSDIQETIDADDNIIRIFPPDYDEAKTAIDFLMSKIKSTYCIHSKCPHHHQKNNIIVIHNGTYGAAIKEQSEIAYRKALKKFYYKTHVEIEPIDLSEAINFHSFDYKSNGKLIYDQIESDKIAPFLKQWENSINYFYIVGYEPNISHMLNALDKELATHPKISKNIIFCGTLSMTSWRNDVKSTLETSKNLQQTIGETYFLELQTHEKKSMSIPPSQELTIELTHHIGQGKVVAVNLEKELLKILSHLTPDEVKDYLLKYWQRPENYISIFSKLSMLIAKESIESKSTLLQSKSKILFDYKKDIKILVNGDSIDHYDCVPLKEH